ncbi:MAG: pantoate--beta-alanine ligase, partial [Pseudomonadota bacterium]
DLRAAIQSIRSSGKKVALVPTMGALHVGHLSLVELAREKADSVIVSIFVNPTQFGANEDFSKYPRTEEDDLAKLEKLNLDIVYLPSIAEMYDENAKTFVRVKDISEELCGFYRPGHFDGVATIVTKLFMQALPDFAIFGEKDYQQLHIIRQFTKDLDIPVEIISAPIMREPDGLAMSSRNRYLNAEERIIAASLYRTLCETAEKIMQGQDIEEILNEAKANLIKLGFNKIDYIELRDAKTLAPAQDTEKSTILLAAVHLGKTRLIDNITVTIE